MPPGFPRTNLVAQHSLLPHETTRLRGTSREHKHLHVRVRNQDMPVLEQIARDAWLSYVCRDITVLVSTPTIDQRLVLDSYEQLTLEIPIPRFKPNGTLAKGKDRHALPFPVSAVRFLPGHGSSLARRALITLAINR